jgi:hypothetical protein
MELLPCPFCNESNIEVKPSDIQTWFTFTCSHCCLSYDGDEYGKKWNTRPSQWISVKDRLPENKDNYVYIVTIYSHYKNNIFVEPLKYIYDQWCNMHDEELLDGEYEVTHWMPLPSPPKENE